MLRKCLIIIALVAVCGPPALAHEIWGYNLTRTVQWEWETRLAPAPPVKMKVVMWAGLYFRYDSEEHRDRCLILRQQIDDGNFYDCIDMLLCVNFKGILVCATYIWDVDPTGGNNGENYRIAVVNEGEDPDTVANGWSAWAVNPSDALHVTTMHLTGNEKVITICLEARGIDALFGTSQDAQIEVGTVITTLTPTIAPPGEPADGILDTEYIGSWIP